MDITEAQPGAKTNLNTFKTMTLHSAWRQTSTREGVNPLTKEERVLGQS